MQLKIVARGTARWDDCAAVARTRYWKDYEAITTPRAERFAYLTDNAGDILGADGIAVAGITHASSGDLMAENYFCDGVAAAVSDTLGRDVDRNEIVEIGPLAATTPGVAARLCSVLPALCWCNGASTLVCTVTQKVAGLLDRLNIDFVPLATARLDQLPEHEQPLWGSYYDTEPVSGFIDLSVYEADLLGTSSTSGRAALTVVK